jgi:hypothetical protein
MSLCIAVNLYATVRADSTGTVVIRNGFIHAAFLGGDANAVWQLTAPAFFYEFGGDLRLVNTQNLVVPLGTPFDFSAHVTAPTAGLFLYQGQVYGDLAPRPGGVVADLLTLSTNTLIPGGPYEYQVQIPFSMHGHAFGSLVGASTFPPPFLDLNVYGGGYATGSLQLQNNHLVLRQVDYTFTPIPEPSSGSLLFTGVLFVAVLLILYSTLCSSRQSAR